ncbi:MULTISPECIES: AAA family ATPase [unclassified Mucilaginibacter]|uniref:ATP-dependent DNA helicase n=1 Tax=unclassified Mucilaginibacter TaxID=2617802 RepID=UPI002AC907BE|nr:MULTISPECIES: AAA family ATPase [unclassified Mucilaginibacter]MEB0260382.1 AAA family ATPase [Mucilaginibacter sp. 10I4]MEB0279421.1 AAA family ATPase [Mucilaginibacter sp. 10B2]MEB0300549.1 AAA family ATPase [Mucilaginibacter sp. 5C4]WPX21795.1 AAA family ATPase [Mucilaginibacter sp. 5C4]
MPTIDHIRQGFPHEPTLQQLELFSKLDIFLSSEEQNDCFILKGYAGTGKTTVLGALVKALPNYNLKAVLLAPTGRAAKVITNYSGRKAFTIHKRIYRKKSALNVDESFMIADNMSTNTLFIIDEASMISDELTGNNRETLLHDLVTYVYNEKNCKLMLVGDTAQLPPVGADDSPALDANLMKADYGLTIHTYELTDVLRQQKDSGILYNVTKVRDIIRQGKEVMPQIVTKGYKDVYRMSSELLEDGLNYAYSKYGYDSTLIICRSNKNANLYNRQIRGRILMREEELTGGDQLMVVKNNYFWLEGQEEGSTGFIANGDIARVKKVRRIEEMYGFRFADVQLEFIDYAEDPVLDCKILLDTLYSEAPALQSIDQKRFYLEAMKDYDHIPNKRAKHNELKLNPYYNALQVKFAYAITCHKAQGGQWEAVFVDQGYLTDEMVNTDFLRWFYTACTRATNELYLVNFNKKFFVGGSEEED